MVRGGQVDTVQSWTRAASVSKEGRWTIAELAIEMKPLVDDIAQSPR
jgi:hypothetical protein